MQKDILMKFDEVIDHKKTLAFIYEDKRPEATANDTRRDHLWAFWLEENLERERHRELP